MLLKSRPVLSSLKQFSSTQPVEGEANGDKADEKKIEVVWKDGKGTRLTGELELQSQLLKENSLLASKPFFPRSLDDLPGLTVI